VTAAEALEYGATAMDAHAAMAMRWGGPASETFTDAAQTLRTLRDRLKEEEEFRAAAMDAAEAFDMAQRRPGSLAVEGRAHKCGDRWLDAYRRLVALRAVSKEPPGAAEKEEPK
jgi:hypothetical protein